MEQEGEEEAQATAEKVALPGAAEEEVDQRIAKMAAKEEMEGLLGAAARVGIAAQAGMVDRAAWVAARSSSRLSER